MKYPREPGYLLVVDDNKVNRILLARGLEGDGHKVETAENGKQALNKLRTEAFDLVLLDIEMPEMNGYEVLETCLQDPELRDIPIIMTSSRNKFYRVVKGGERGGKNNLKNPDTPFFWGAGVNATLKKNRWREKK